MDRTEFTRDRSVARCMAEGYRFFSSHLTTIIRRCWLPLTVSSLGFSLTTTMLLSQHGLGAVLFLVVSLVAFCLLTRRSLLLVAPLPRSGNAIAHLLRHLGSYLAYALLSGIVGVVVFTILILPAIILLAYGYADHKLAMLGDPVSIGTGYWLLTNATLTACYALTLFAQTWQTYGAAYLYGAMVAREQAQTHDKNAVKP